MGFGPNGSNGKTFAEMSPEEKKAFASQSAEILGTLSLYKDLQTTTAGLKNAATNGLLYHADGKPVAADEVDDELNTIKTGFENKITTTAFLSDIVFVKYDEQKPENQEFSYYPLSAWGPGEVLANDVPLTAEELDQRYKDEAEEIEIQKKILAERRPVAFDELGPKEYDNVSFDEMSEKKEQEYKDGVADILGKLANNHDVDSTEFQEILVDATKYGMLIYPDGKEITRQEVEAILQNVRQEPDANKKSDILDDITVLEYDPTEGELGFLPLSVQATDVRVRSGSGNYLNETQLNKRKEQYEAKIIRQREKAAKAAQEPVVAAPVVEEVAPVEVKAPAEEVKAPAELVEKQEQRLKEQNEAQVAKLKNWANNDRASFKQFFEKSSRVIDGLSTDGTPANSLWMNSRLKDAIKHGIVHYPDGTVPSSSTIQEIENTPALMKDLVFTSYKEDSFETHHDLYRLKFEDKNGLTQVKLDYEHPLTPADVAQMEQARATRSKKEDVLGLYAQALEPRDEKKLAKYIAELQDYKIDIEPNPILKTFRVPSTGKIYVAGRSTPVKTPDELMSAKGFEPPKEPNSWGIFEFLRKGWHGIFHNVADYVKYEDDLKQYEIDRYHTANVAGFKVDDQKETVERYERELAEKREAAKPKPPQDLEEALKVVRACLDEEQPSDFYRSIEAALKENTEFGSIMRKGFANMEYDGYNGYYRKNELLLAKKQFETDKDSPVLKHYEKYAAVYACGFQRAFTGKVFKNKEWNFAREVNLFIEKACSAASKLSKANPNMAPDKLQAKIDAAMQKRVDTFKDLAKDAVKDDLNTFMEDLYNAERAIASSEEQKAGKVTDVAKAQAATQKIMEGEAEKYAAANPQNNVAQTQSNAPEVQGNVNEATNNNPQPGTGI